MNFIIQRDGQNFGPFSLDQIKEQIKKGYALPTDLAWCEGGTEWTPLVHLMPFQQSPIVLPRSPAQQPHFLSLPSQPPAPAVNHSPMLYVLKGGKQHGPYTENELRGYVAAGSILRSDSAWYEGAAAWAPIESILRFSSAPPPPPPAVGNSASATGNSVIVQVAAPNNNRLIYESQKKSGWVAAFLNLFIPGLGYIYAGMPVTGIIVVFVFLSSIFTIIGPFIILPIIFFGGFSAANRANRRLATRLL